MTHEILDVVDENNNIIDQKPRDFVHEHNLNHRSAHVIVVNDSNQVFLQLRAKSKKQFPNKWDTSAAGHLDAGESYINAAKRELLEELGIDIPLKKFIKIGSTPATLENGFEFVEIFLVKYNGKMQLRYEEVAAGGWFDCDILKTWLKNDPNSFSGGCATIFQFLFDYIN